MADYLNILFIIWPLLLLWWVPLLFSGFFGFLGAGAGAGVNTATNAEAATGNVVGTGVGVPANTVVQGNGFNTLSRNLSRLARDTFIVILFGLLLSFLLLGGITFPIWASAWAAFAFFLLWWLATLFVGWIPILGSFVFVFLGLGFLASILALYAFIFILWI